MKNIDIKSLIIGALLTSTIFLGVAATSPTDKWDENQRWDFTTRGSFLYKADKVEAKADELRSAPGWELFGVQGSNLLFRKRVK